MSNEKKNKAIKKYPFPYLGHGTGYYRKLMECYIIFEDSISDEDKKWIENNVPEMLGDFFEWEYNILHFGSDDGFPYYVFEKFNEDEENAKIINDGESEDITNILYDEEIWDKYHQYLDECINKIHEKNPIDFFIKGLDHEYGYDLDEWHDYSMQEVPEKLIPYFFKIIEKIKLEKNDIDLSNHCWVLNSALWHYMYSFDDLKSIHEFIKKDIIKMISIFNGYDEYIDKYNFEILIEIIYSYSDNEKNNIFISLPPNIQIKILETSKKGSDLLLLLIKENEIINYLKNIIEKKEKNTSLTMYRIGYNIANINMEDLPGKTGVKITTNENSKPLLGAGIIELGLDFPDADENQFIYASIIYNDNDMYEKSLSLCEKAVEKKIITPQIFSNIIYTAGKLGNKNILDEYLETFVSNEKFINDPFSLSNIIYLLNRKGMCEQAVKLTGSYIKMPNREMLASLYINLSDTYIVANEYNDDSEKLINEALQMIELNDGYFGANLSIMLGNIACYFAVKNDKENAVKYIDLAKKNNYPNIENLREEKCFEKWKENEEFIKLFNGHKD